MSKVVNFIVSLFWVTKDRAIASGLAHHGSLYGVPSWVRVDGDIVHGCAKVPMLTVWCVVCEWIFDIWAGFMSTDQELVSPIYIGKSIEG